MSGIRARVRAELTAEIKQLAREQIAADGAANLSLRAIARRLDMASSAIYRYFPSRDQLLTELIIDSYDELGAVAESADARCARDDHLGRWRAVAHAIRDWAVARPADYGLLYGTPVPGYAAPPDTIGPAGRYTAVLLQLLVDLQASGHLLPESPSSISGDAHAEYEAMRERLQVEVPDELLLAGISAWMTLFGALTFELFGHLHNVLDVPGEHYGAMVDLIAERFLLLPLR
jgi:AcrR family transcriptional regulator